MFNLTSLAASVLDSLDNVAKETLEEPKVSATSLRKSRKLDTTRSTHESNSQADYFPTNKESQENSLKSQSSDDVNDQSFHESNSFTEQVKLPNMLSLSHLIVFSLAE